MNQKSASAFEPRLAEVMYHPSNRAVPMRQRFFILQIDGARLNPSFV